MKKVLMNSDENNKRFKTIIPSEKNSKKVKNKEEIDKQNLKEETEEKDVEEKDVDVAEVNVNDNEFSKELKKRTDGVLKDYFKNPPTQLTYSSFENDMNAVIEGALSEQDKIKKQQKKGSRKERLKALKNKLFRRRKDG